MKIKQSPEWFLRMADLEEGCDISAGKQIFHAAAESQNFVAPAKPKRKPRHPSATAKKLLKRRPTSSKSLG